MKPRLGWALTMGLCLCSGGAASVFARSGQAPVAFHLTFQKTAYTRTDPIEVTLSLENKGRKPVWVNKRFYLNADTQPPEERDVILEVTSPTGEKVPCTYSHQTGLPRTEHFELLQPGRRAEAERPHDLRNYFDVAALGRYTVVGIYTNVFGQEIGLDALTGPVRSKPVTFTIVE